MTWPDIFLSSYLRKNRVSVVVSSTSIGRVHYSQLQALTTAEQTHGHGGSTTGRWVATRPKTAECKSWVDLDTESTGSFFHDKSLTLGSLIGVSSILELSRRSTRGRTTETLREQKNYKSKPWMFSICSRLSPDVVNTNNNAPSLGHFLEVERRAAANIHRRNMIYGPRNFSPILPNSGVNSQFLGDQIAPQSSASLGVDGGRRSNTELLQHGTGYGASLVLSCLCGQLIEWWWLVKHFTCSYVPGFWIIQLQVWEVKH